MDLSLMSLFAALAVNLCSNLKIADCLFDAKANSASHLTLSPSARGGSRFSGDRATCLALLTLGDESS